MLEPPRRGGFSGAAAATMIFGSLDFGALQSRIPSAINSLPRKTLYFRFKIPSLACTEAG